MCGNFHLGCDLSAEKWKQEVHDQTLVGKRADLTSFGVSVAVSKREEASSGPRNPVV